MMRALAGRLCRPALPFPRYLSLFFDPPDRPDARSCRPSDRTER